MIDGARAVSRGFLARISLFGFGYSALALSFTVVVLPARILDVAPEGSKNTYLGVLSAVGLLVAVAVQPLAGAASDRWRSRWGRRAPFIAVGALLSAPLIVAAGGAPTYVTLFLLICLLQLCSNIAQGPYQGLVRDYVPREHRGAASGMKWMLEVGGAMAVTALVGVMMGRADEGGSFSWVWGALALLAALFVLGAAATAWSVRSRAEGKGEAAPITGRPTGHRRRVGGSPGGEAERERAPLVSKDMRWFLASRFFLAAAAASLQTYALFFLRDRVGVENASQTVGLLVLIVGGGLVAVVYPAGALADRVGRKPVMLAGGVVGLAGMAVLLASPTLPGVYAASAVAGVAMGVFLGANWAMAIDLVSSRRTAQQLGYVNIATVAGAALAKLNGVWVDALNDGDGGRGYTVLFIVYGILFAAGTLLVLRVRDRSVRSGVPSSLTR